MRTLYLECAMGAAGDMLMGALLELHPKPEDFLHRLNHLGIPGVTITREVAETQGIMGTHMHVSIHGQEEHVHEAEHSHEHAHKHSHDHGHEHAHEHNHDHGHEHTHEYNYDHSHTHHHASLRDISHVIEELPLPPSVQENVMAVYASIAEAEARAHGKPVSQIHFHEVGTLDAVADVVGVCLLLHELAPEEILASPVHTGSGHVHCTHGILPVPAPATAFLLEGIPSYGGEIQGELCTPTGAALLRHFVTRFGNRPVMTVEQIGYGIGAKSFPRANCLRAMLGYTDSIHQKEDILELSCNIDDMTPEDLACGMELLREAGALEVYTTSANMKKGRPGVVLTCICYPSMRERLVTMIFRHVSTLGIRENILQRYVLNRELRTEETPLGTVRYKTATGYGIIREKPELEDLYAIAREQGMSLAQVRQAIQG